MRASRKTCRFRMPSGQASAVLYPDSIGFRPWHQGSEVHAGLEVTVAMFDRTDPGRSSSDIGDSDAS